MSMKIQTKAVVTYTCELSDEDLSKIKEYIDSHNPSWMTEEKYNEREILEAVKNLSSNLEIYLYKESVESDFSTVSIEWSEFEDRNPQEIIESV